MLSNRKPVSETKQSGISDLYSEQRARQLRQLLAGMRSQESQWMRAMRDRDSLDCSTLGDEGDEAASDEGFELTASLAELAGSRAAAVESALERLGDGHYGVCEACEEEIPLERLQAMPWTLLCVDCQREHEATSRHSRADASALWVTPEESPRIGSEPTATGDDGNPETGDATRKKRGRPRSRPAHSDASQ